MNITIFVTFKDKAAFFIRVANVFESNYNVTFLTTRYSTYRIIKDSGYKVDMLQNFIKYETDVKIFKKFEDEAILMDVKVKNLSEKRAQKQFEWLSKGFKKYFEIKKVDKLIIWNGSMLQGYTASLVAESFNIKKLFFEVGNFPNKIFVDEKGVNAKSSLMDRDLTTCKDYNKEEILNFLKKHKKMKEEVHIIPQAMKKSKDSKLYFVWDILYNKFSKYPILENEKGMVDFLKYRFFNNSIDIDYDSVDYKKEDYILFPLQVSVDSQIIRNSDITLEEAIDKAVDIAKKDNLKLIIKPHPSEKNLNIINKIRLLQKSNKNIILVNYNIYLLIRYAKKVVTINSTVGIESLMYYTHTEVLGQAFYKKYCENDIDKAIDKNKINRFLFNYFFNVLKDGDYFGNKTIGSILADS